LDNPKYAVNHLSVQEKKYREKYTVMERNYKTNTSKKRGEGNRDSSR